MGQMGEKTQQREGMEKVGRVHGSRQRREEPAPDCTEHQQLPRAHQQICASRKVGMEALLGCVPRANGDTGLGFPRLWLRMEQSNTGRFACW